MQNIPGANVKSQQNPWAAYHPSADNPWDLRKVAHLHRRAGFGATWSELQRDLRDGPTASVDRLLSPRVPSADEGQVLDSLRQGVLDARDSDRLKAWWLYRILYDPDPLREKVMLFWHSHFATSNRKVESVALMLQQNELLRRHALGNFADMLEGIIGDPAMFVWLDGAASRRERPNENFAREFLELFTLGPGHYTEADIRQAARAFTGWVRVPDESFSRDTPRFRFEPAGFDDGEKVFLRQRGRWNACDIVRITLERPAAAEFLCRKLYRFLVREDAEPSAELIRPLAAELRRQRFSIRHVVALILRSLHFYDPAVFRQRVKTPVEFSAGLLRMLEVPRANVRILALAAACDRQGQELFYPPNVRGWVGGRTWLNSTTMLQRGNWANDVVWGNPDLGMPAYDPPAWAARHQVPPARSATALLDLLLQDDVDQEERRLVLRTAANGGADGLRRALQLLLHCPRFQLA
jgi:uncharacterized protein (DUF1800 family)